MTKILQGKARERNNDKGGQKILLYPYPGRGVPSNRGHRYGKRKDISKFSRKKGYGKGI